MDARRILSRSGRLGWYVAGFFGLLTGAALAGVAQGGALDPLGAPASTMRTLDTFAPAWHQGRASGDGPDSCHSSRFLCVMDGNAVLDRETGLVWEKSPGAVQLNWVNAESRCATLVTGGRLGWRLPAVEELLSLGDADGSGVPAGAPFLGVLTGVADRYWTATHHDAIVGTTLTVSLSNLSDVAFPPPGSPNNYSWCVRGGQGYDSL